MKWLVEAVRLVVVRLRFILTQFPVLRFVMLPAVFVWLASILYLTVHVFSLPNSKIHIELLSLSINISLGVVVITTLLLLSTMIVLETLARRLLKISNSILIAKNSRKKRQQAKAVTETYADELRANSWPLVVILITFAGGLWFVNQTSGALIAVIGSCVVLLHLSLTYYRVRRGLFGSNAQEASELIQFILKKTAEGGGPPGSRLSRPYVAPQEEDKAVTKAAGAVS